MEHLLSIFQHTFQSIQNLKNLLIFFQCYIEIENCHALKIAYGVKVIKDTFVSFVTMAITFFALAMCST